MSETITTDYRSTLNLPKTAFPMKADLPKREPARVAWWRERGVYERRLQRNAEHPLWILHDGPPYANGEVHMGTFLNRVVKDIFVKFHLLEGRFAKFVPGWDMHGLPIEFETLKHLKLDFRKVDPIALRAKCRERAIYWLGVQRETFLRMGLLGEFDHPYRTIDKEFEAVIVETLADLAEVEQLYKGLRATLWCIHDETALAEAEIEYKERTSPSIYVRFSASEAQRADILQRFGVETAGLPKRLSVIIWTTTPWTLPANVAIAVKPDAAYGLYRTSDELYIVATALEADVRSRSGRGGALGFSSPGELLATTDGLTLLGATVRHPFLDRSSEIVTADYVELDTGTGAVHTAPGHGVDDFETGTRFGLPILNPVDASGHFTEQAGPRYAGLQVFEANEPIIDDLRASGALLAAESFEHSYPHCWRCKNPVIFRATAQWFIAMDMNRLRERAQEKIPTVTWYPAWGETRMTQMIENHPEWCISRQRTWGTPIPSLVCNACGEAFLDAEVARTVARLFRERGGEDCNASDLWWTQDVSTFVPPGLECPKCRGRSFSKEFNIVDIWFESGVTHRAVLKRPGLHWPADLYLEGSDQYRGWFRSNLITAVATQGAAPYKAVVSTGWVVDADGRAMHKSAGNYVGAKEAMEKYGADVLRLWTASVEFTTDMRFGATLLESVGSVYRNLRYRLRMLLGLVDDLEPQQMIAHENLEPVDRLALARLAAMTDAIIAAYNDYRLHDVYLALVAYDAEDLSRFYIDLLKDPMYSGERDGHRRRSAQTALFTILRQLCALLAPLLSFTAEEAWQFVPAPLREPAASVFDLDFWHGAYDESSLELWELLKRLRAEVAASEGVRDFQLQATVYANNRSYEQLRALGDNLREALVVSALTLRLDSATDEPQVTLSPARGEKCSRCWKYLELGSDPVHPTLCTACAAIVRTFDAA
ncbi:MAG TPA: isoleucine--tRNA ligase [Candidatus Acidoferrales bacterium]|nr:isoleucine--tRNA ligase [Candidatus Acidoferrales bacterium]